ncbi:response regulator [Oceaniglobus roseus]|uniref:response regulator n=1 Tax=Oceaniglobus roseus TaxID=1737570 RepID=UPI0013001129|nr:response regulator [Kandeliimicrobium roseum]
MLLTHRRVLIVEDDFHLALELARHFEDAGAEVLGPSATLGNAWEKVASADVAVLDINLRGALVYPLADSLQRRGIPFVFYTASEAAEMPPRFRHVGRFRKPADAMALLDGMFSGETDVVDLLPKLRLMARLMYDEPHSADRLVERTLEQALRAYEFRPCDVSVEKWLFGILAEIAERQGGDLLT